MKHKFKQILSALLSLIMMAGMLTGLIPQALALSGGDKVALVFDSDKQNYFQEQKGGAWVSLPIHECYATENGEKLLSYCMDHGRHGIHEIAPSTNRHTYVLDAGSGYKQNPKAVGVIMRGSGRLSLQSFLNQFTSVPRDLTEDEYRYATQTAMWASLGQLSVSGTPFTSGNAVKISSQYSTQGARVMAATQALLNYAAKIDHNYYVGMYLTHGAAKNESGDLDWSPVSNAKELNAEKTESLNGKEYYTQEIKVASASFCQNYDLQVGLYEQLDGTLIQIIKDGDHASEATPQAYSSPISVKPISQTTNANANGAEYYAIVKVWVPKDAADAKGAYAFNVQTSANVEAFDIFVGRASGYESSTAYQKYLISGPQWKTIGNKLTIKWGNAEIPEDPDLPSNPDDPNDPDTPEPSTGSLTIRKVDAETGASLGDCTVQLEHITSGYKTTVTTIGDGIAAFELPADKLGGWKATEIVAPPGYELDENPVQTFSRDGSNSPITLTFQNHQKPSIQFIKRDAVTGETLAGAVIEVSRNDQKIGDYTTEADGTFTLDELLEGTYTFREKQAPEGYLLSDEVVTQYVDPAKMATENRVVPVEMKNYAELQLKIVKYDMQSKKKLPNVTFEIYRDTELIETAQTNANGEILLTGLLHGTYLAKEVATDDAHVVSSTPQQIELKAGQTGVQTLVFLNQLKPGIHLVKVDSVTMKSLPNVRFEFKLVGGSYRQEFTTDINGEIDLSKLELGTYEVRELEAPDGYLIDDAVRVVQVNPDENANFVFTNTPKPALRLIKTSSDGSQLAGVHFRIAKIEDGSRYLDRITDTNGEINIPGLEPGVYSVRETATVSDHILDLREYHVELFPGQTSTITIENQKRPNLIVYKHDADTDEPVPNTIFLVKAADGHSVDEIKTDTEGKAALANLLPGVYEISEKSVPAPYLMDAEPQLVTLYANKDHTVYFENHKKPALTVNKVDSITGSPIKGAKFEVWYGSNNTTTGELNSLGTYFSDENGQFTLELLRDGWYKVTELEPAAGFTIKQPATQEFYIKGGESKTIIFENVPKNAIVVEKYDSVTGEALSGCTFQLRYLAGTSGTGGTVIGQKVTGKNGMAIWTGLEPGTYVLEEIDPADGYSIIQSSETIFLADSGEQSVVTVRFENSPDGMLLIRKVCSVNPSVTLQNAEFKVMYADGTLIGDSNGIYRTDENGEIRITGLKPGKSVVVTETKAPAGFLIDTQSQTVQIKEGRTVSLTFKNQPKGQLIIQKRDSATGQPLSGAEFRVTTAAGCEVGLDGVIGTSTLTQNGIFTTDAQGEIRITNLAPGAYVLTEIKAPDGYVMDAPSTNVVIGANGDTQTVNIKNSKAGTLVIDKRDSLTGKPLEGVTFKVTTSTGEFVPDENGKISSNGLYFTDKDGKITIHGVVGTLVVTETATIPGYTIDEATRTQTVVVNPNDTQTLHFTNTPSTTLVIEKYIEGTTTPLKGVTFLVTDSSGAVVGSSNGEYITDENGRIVIEGLEPGITVTAREVKTREGYVLDTSPKSIKIKEGEVQTLRFYNSPQGTIVIRKLDSVTKEPLAGGGI